MTRAYGRVGGACVLVVAAISLAACTSGSTAPHVASLGNSSDPSSSNSSSASAQPAGNPTQLLDEWAVCMRSHGDPNQVDPTVDANKVIHITIPAGVNGGPINLKSGNGPMQACNSYLTAASTALRGGAPLPKPDPAKLEKFSECMRANGIPDFPDPSGGRFQLSSGPGSDLNRNNPIFQRAQQKCATQVGIPQLAGGPGTQAGSVQVQQQGAPGGGGAISG
jgi:hypothetical protein